MKVELLFRLRGVPDDEADAIRQLLIDADIHFYETSAGSWGIGVAAIWLNDAGESAKAKALMHQYQLNRQQQQKDTLVSTQWQHFCENPWRLVGFSLFILFIVFITLSPFFFF